MKSFFTYVLFLIICTSCASIINKRTQKIYITSADSTIVLQGNDTISLSSKEHVLRVKRSPLSNDLLLKTKNNQISEISLHPKSATAYYLNYFYIPTGFIGLLIDGNKPKRYEYYQDYRVDFNNVLSKPAHLGYKQRAKNNPNVLKVTPLKFIGQGNQASEISYERRLNDLFSVQLMASSLHYSYNGAFYNDGFVDGSRFALETRYFKAFKKPGAYLAFEIDYYQLDRKIDQVFYNPTEGVRITNTYRLDKRVNSYNIKLGRQKYINNFVIDTYIGLGIRFRNITSNKLDVAPENYLLLEERQSFVITDQKRIGKTLAISLPLNVRIGYAF